MTTTTTKKPTLKQTAKTLRKTADHIERVGLLKGSFYPQDVLDDYGTRNLIEKSKKLAKDVPCCTLGGIYFVSKTVEEADAADRILAEYLPDRYWGDVAEWSDMPSRRKGQVVKKLRDVADKLEAA